MTPDERAAFIAKLQATGALLGHRMRDDVAEVYARVLDDIPVAQLLLALDRLARTVDSATRFPGPRELRQLAGGAWHAPHRNLNDHEAGRLHQHVFEAMARWERDDGHGLARPAFDRAWKAALHAERITNSPQLVQAREATWQQWLKAGAPLTRERMIDILADVAPKGAPTFLRAMRDLVERIERDDEPAAVSASPMSPLATVVQIVLDREASDTAVHRDGSTGDAVPEPPVVPEDVMPSDVVVLDATANTTVDSTADATVDSKIDTTDDALDATVDTTVGRRVDTTVAAPAEPAALPTATPDTPAAPAEPASPVEPPPFPEF